MKDFFGTKRIKELERGNERLQNEVRMLKNQVEYLVRTLRDMDQEIWNMGQRTDWNGMRPHFNKLHEGTISRKHAENERISSIIRGELIDTYKPNTKQIGHKS